MKRFIGLLLALALLAMFTGCAGPNGNVSAPTSVPGGKEDSAETESPVDPANDPTNAPSDATPAQSDPTDAPSTPTDAPLPGTEGLAYSKKLDRCVITGIGTATTTDIVIPSEIEGLPVTDIDEDAFHDASITSVYIPSSVKLIDEDAFAGCVVLKSVTLSQGLEYISSSAFYACRSLKEIKIPESVISIGDKAFFGCSSLTEVAVEGIPSLYGGCFKNCSALKSFKMGEGKGYTYTVASDVFSGCPALEVAVFAEGAEGFGSWCFYGTSSLREIYIPKTVAGIDSSAFSSSGVKYVYYAGSEEEWKAINIGSSNDALDSAVMNYNVKY